MNKDFLQCKAIFLCCYFYNVIKYKKASFSFRSIEISGFQRVWSNLTLRGRIQLWKMILYLLLLILYFTYSFDVRGRAFSKALYWSDTNAFGPRAYFLTVKKPATLSVENVQLDDEGVSFMKIYGYWIFMFIFQFFTITGLSLSSGLPKFTYKKSSHQFNSHWWVKYDLRVF